MIATTNRTPCTWRVETCPCPRCEDRRLDVAVRRLVSAVASAALIAEMYPDPGVAARAEKATRSIARGLRRLGVRVEREQAAAELAKLRREARALEAQLESLPAAIVSRREVHPRRMRHATPSDSMRLVRSARAAGAAQIRISTGGGVANSYKWKTTTEVALEIGTVSGAHVIWSTWLTISGRNVSTGRGVEECVPGAGDLGRSNVTAEDRILRARIAVLRAAIAELSAATPAERGRAIPPSDRLTPPPPQRIAVLLDEVGPAGEQAEIDARRYRLDYRHATEVRIASDGSALLLGYAEDREIGSILVVRDSTVGDRHLIRVPPQFAGHAGSDDVAIHAARAWTFGLGQDDFAPDVEA